MSECTVICVTTTLLLDFEGFPSFAISYTIVTIIVEKPLATALIFLLNGRFLEVQQVQGAKHLQGFYKLHIRSPKSLYQSAPSSALCTRPALLLSSSSISTLFHGTKGIPLLICLIYETDSYCLNSHIIEKFLVEYPLISLLVIHFFL